MKRFVSVLLVLVLAVCLMAGCGGKKSSGPDIPTPVAATGDPEFENDSTAADVAEAKMDLKSVLSKVKVGFIFLHDENST
ncbi:MAG: hypothetical protein K5981_03050, partial [Clostridia bacterium]|nr:hypothetical protein [Clostridia bacterium]